MLHGALYSVASIHTIALWGLMTVFITCKLPGEAKCFPFIHDLCVANFPPVSSSFIKRQHILQQGSAKPGWLSWLLKEDQECVASAESEEAVLHSSDYSYAPFPASGNKGETAVTILGSSFDSLSQLFPFPSSLF